MPWPTLGPRTAKEQQGSFKVMGNVTHHSIDRVRLRSYSTLIETDILYRFPDIASYLPKVTDFDPPHPTGITLSGGAFGAPAEGDPGGISLTSLVSENWILCMGWCCLCDPMFSRLSRTPTGRDRQTDTSP